MAPTTDYLWRAWATWAPWGVQFGQKPQEGERMGSLWRRVRNRLIVRSCPLLGWYWSGAVVGAKASSRASAARGAYGILGARVEPSARQWIGLAARTRVSI